MAIYHLETKVVSRGTGRSAVAAAAYMSCSQILNDYDGVQHDFTRKKGLVWQQIFLPEYAPVEWQERAVLWNAVEENEKTKDSRLAREFVVALPVELNKKPWKACCPTSSMSSLWQTECVQMWQFMIRIRPVIIPMPTSC